MPLPLLAAQGIMTGIGVLGNLLGNRQQTTTQRSRQNTHSTSNVNNYNQGFGTSSSNPVYDTAAWNYRNQLMGDIQGRLNQPLSDPSQLAKSVTTQQLWDSGQANEILKKQLQQAYASQGLNYGAMGAAPQTEAASDLVRQRMGILNNRFLLEDEFRLRNENTMRGRIGDAMQMFGMIPYGQEQSYDNYSHGTQLGEQTGTQEGWSETKGPGNAAAGGLQGLGMGLADMFGTMYGRNNPQVNYGSPTPQGMNWIPRNQPNTAQLTPFGSFNPYLRRY